MTWNTIGSHRVVACLMVLLMTGCSASPGNPKVPAGAKSSGGNHAVIETDKGEIQIEFDAPANVPTTMGPDGNMSRPLSPPLIRKVTIRP